MDPEISEALNELNEKLKELRTAMRLGRTTLKELRYLEEDVNFSSCTLFSKYHSFVTLVGEIDTQTHKTIGKALTKVLGLLPDTILNKKGQYVSYDIKEVARLRLEEFLKLSASLVKQGRNKLVLMRELDAKPEGKKKKARRRKKATRRFGSRSKLSTATGPQNFIPSQSSENYKGSYEDEVRLSMHRQVCKPENTYFRPNC